MDLELFIDYLAASDHFLVYTHQYEEESTYIVASGSLIDHPETVHQILTEAFHVGNGSGGEDTPLLGDEDEAHYILILSPTGKFIWRGPIMMLSLPRLDLDAKENRCRLVADGPRGRLALAKEAFFSMFQVFVPLDEDGVPVEIDTPVCTMEGLAHLPVVNRELRKISRATMRLAESIVDSVHHVYSSMEMTQAACQDLMDNWYRFASQHGLHSQLYMDKAQVAKFNRLLIKLAISWVSFVCDDCDPNDRKTFKWAVFALTFALKSINMDVLNLPDDQFQMLRHKVAICINLLTGHFDILGARSSLEARKEKEKQEEELRQQALQSDNDDEELTSPDLPSCASAQKYVDRLCHLLDDIEQVRAKVGLDNGIVGRVLDTEKPEDRSLLFLASASSKTSIRWQQGKFIGSGAFGSVYLAVNLDTGSLMAVKEIKFQELSGHPSLYTQIKEELSVMEMLHHPNIVEYYGIEVHRDKVYIFEEYCKGGSLAAFLEHGRVEDEGITQVYTMQMLEGLNYLHSQNIVHRDVKPDSAFSEFVALF